MKLSPSLPSGEKLRIYRNKTLSHSYRNILLFKYLYILCYSAIDTFLGFNYKTNEWTKTGNRHNTNTFLFCMDRTAFFINLSVDVAICCQWGPLNDGRTLLETKRQRRYERSMSTVALASFSTAQVYRLNVEILFLSSRNVIHNSC